MAKVAMRLVGMTEAQSEENLFLMLMREINGDRHLPVLLGVSEAHMVSLAKRGMSPLRPMFFESFGQAFIQFDIELMECYIYRFEREIYSCYLIFRQQDRTVTVDARLSDALALAIYMDASI